ncbi:PREDICTED: centromere protein P isoform X2 [Chinchilla lanigera]|uniref:centromere protein P isoform X2 n=1 Tax=Chinchilla lanigera TaxID=34839 RepID=UPI000698C4DD|nr:PREDICTED: centromere protein P isoform X2 [Chinchilla lanigera]
MEAERAEVRALNAEIAALRRACEQLPAPREDATRVRKSFTEIHQSDSVGWESSKDLRSHLRHLESELSFLSMLTGFSITGYSKKTEDLTSTEMKEEGIKKVLQRHRLSGNCNIVTFQLEFQILETQNKENLSSVITDLGIIMEPTEYSELSDFVSRAEERRDLFMFFRGLHFFVKWCEYRKRTFKHFKKRPGSPSQEPPVWLGESLKGEEIFREHPTKPMLELEHRRATLGHSPLATLLHFPRIPEPVLWIAWEHSQES